MTTATKTARVDVYTRVTNRIVKALEQGVRPGMKPWHAEHAAGRITRPLRHNGQKYSGINLASWLTVLKADNRAIFTASSHASKAVDFLHSLQPLPVE